MLSSMAQDHTPAEFRAAALRMVAAAEYFKAAGALPPWARTELESWSAPCPAPTDERPGAPTGSHA